MITLSSTFKLKYSDILIGPTHYIPLITHIFTFLSLFFWIWPFPFIPLFSRLVPHSKKKKKIFFFYFIFKLNFYPSLMASALGISHPLFLFLFFFYNWYFIKIQLLFFKPKIIIIIIQLLNLYMMLIHVPSWFFKYHKCVWVKIEAPTWEREEKKIVL